MRFETIFFIFFVMTSFRHHDMTNKKRALKLVDSAIQLHVTYHHNGRRLLRSKQLLGTR